MTNTRRLQISSAQNLFPSHTTIGFDNLLFDKRGEVPNYPPYNIIKESEEDYLIEIALAGFKPSEIDVNLDGNRLIIQKADDTSKNNNDSTDYIFKGISNKSFKREFVLAEHVQIVTGARDEVQMVNGILKIRLRHVIPQELKAKRFKVT